MPKAKTTNNITSLLKQLRPYLPGKVVKTSPFSYLVADSRVVVELDYYCNWKEKQDGMTEEKKAKTCLPQAIKVSPSTAFVSKALGSKTPGGYSYSLRPRDICGDRTYHKRVDGTFNFERIAVAITKTAEAVDDTIVQRKEQEKLRKTRYKISDANNKRLNNLLKNYKKEYDQYTIYIENRTEEDPNKLRYQLRLNGVPEAQLLQILSILETIPPPDNKDD